MTPNRKKVINGHTVTQYYSFGVNLVYIDDIGTALTFKNACDHLQGTQDKSKSDSIENLEKNQEPLDPEFSKVIDENYWELI